MGIMLLRAVMEVVLVLCGVFSLMSFGGLKSAPWQVGEKTCPVVEQWVSAGMPLGDGKRISQG